ncbi:MAG: N-6 DNA methylase [Oscillospiraceae bacterium]|nr:N-6 DNA methylase [Oscillospiraceae bacterium]
MITESNFRDLLLSLNFSENNESYEKDFFYYDMECKMCADFSERKLYYPSVIKGRERNNTFDAPENFVVFECVNRLLEKGYRPEHIELEKEWHLGHDPKSGRADICVSDENGNMLFIVECKTWGKEFDKALSDTKSDGAQLFSYWQQEQSCKWLVLYASNFRNQVVEYKAPTVNCTDDANVRKLAEKDKSIKLYAHAHTAQERHEAWKETYSSQIHDDLVFSDKSVAYQIGVKPLLKKDLLDFSPDDKIVNKFEEILRHNNVSDKENAFNRLVALFICKLVDESTKDECDEVEFQYKISTDTYESLQDRLQRLYRDGMEKFMHEKILYVRSDYPEWLFSNYTGSKRKNAIKDLEDTIRILKFYSNNDFAFKDVHNEELFYQNGKVLVEMVQLFEKYRIVYSSKHQFLGDLFEQLLNKGFKQNEGQFFTPMPITRFIWDSLPVDKMVRSEKGTIYPRVIDYACGAGHFLTEAVEAINFFANSDGDNTWTRDHIYGIEKDYRLARVAKISLFMNGAGDGNIIFGDGLENEPDKGIDSESFDILAANPPYAVKDFKQHLQLKNNNFELLDQIGRNGSEIEVLFVERIEQLLKPHGIAAVILPSSILSNDNASYVGAREHILQNFYIRAIVALGAKTFAATGTNTVIMFLEKFSEPPKQCDLVSDSVYAIFNSDNLDNWQDKDILEAYTSQIEVDENTYKAFIRKELSLSELENNNYFKMYVSAFPDSTDAKSLAKNSTYKKSNASEKETKYLEAFYNYVHSIEREKLKYFSFVYRQSTVIITAPADNKAQKEFLGYEWSNRKGNEGIQILTPGGKLYNNSDRAAEETLASLIKKSYQNIVPSISEEQQAYANIISSKDMLDFSRVSFNKSISLKRANQFHIVSKYALKALGTYPDLEIQKGKSITESDAVSGPYKVVAGGKSYAYTHNSYNREENVITVSASGANAGYVNFWSEKIFASDCTTIRSDDLQDTLFIYHYLKCIQDQIYFVLQRGSAQPHVYPDDIKQIPIPSISTELKNCIVSECHSIDKEIEKTHLMIEKYRKEIENLFNEVDMAHGMDDRKSLEELVVFNPPKSEIADLDNSLPVSFVEMASVSNQGYIESKVDKPLSQLKTGSYTYFTENDIIIAKITPCMENGKCAIATGLTNGIAFGSSEFHVLRCKENVLNKYVFGFINRESVRQDAAKVMTGSSGHRRVPVSFYEKLSIPVIPLIEQELLVTKVNELESHINEMEKQLKSLDGKFSEIFDNYLN